MAIYMTQTATAAPSYFCSREIGPSIVHATNDITACAISSEHWVGTHYIRVDMCGTCHADKKAARAPRKPRQAATYVATDWNMLVAFSKKAGR